MKIPMTCFECFKLDKKPSTEFLWCELEDTGVYSVTCSRKHNTNVLLQNEKFEILFDQGGMALLEGYPRQAVSDFSSSLERFHEFCIRVFLAEKEVSTEKVKEIWKCVESQSERQLGAFFFIYLLTFDEHPPGFITNPNNYSHFRNKVIHKGYIPKLAEARNFGRELFDYMRKIISKLKTKFGSSGLTKVTIEGLSEKHSKAELETRSTMHIPTMLNLIDDTDKSFENALEALDKEIKKFYRKS